MLQGEPFQRTLLLGGCLSCFAWSGLPKEPSTRLDSLSTLTRCEKSGDTQNLWLNLSDGCGPLGVLTQPGLTVASALEGSLVGGGKTGSGARWLGQSIAKSQPGFGGSDAAKDGSGGSNGALDHFKEDRPWDRSYRSFTDHWSLAEPRTSLGGTAERQLLPHRGQARNSDHGPGLALQGNSPLKAGHHHAQWSRRVFVRRSLGIAVRGSSSPGSC